MSSMGASKLPLATRARALRRRSLHALDDDDDSGHEDEEVPEIARSVLEGVLAGPNRHSIGPYAPNVRSCSQDVHGLSVRLQCFEVRRHLARPTRQSFTISPPCRSPLCRPWPSQQCLPTRKCRSGSASILRATLRAPSDMSGLDTCVARRLHPWFSQAAVQLSIAGCATASGSLRRRHITHYMSS